MVFSCYMHTDVTCGTTWFCIGLWGVKGVTWILGLSLILYFSVRFGTVLGSFSDYGYRMMMFSRRCGVIDDIFWLLWIFSQFISLYYTVRNGESFHRGEYLWYVTYMFKVTYVMILIVCLFPGDLWLTLIFSTIISLSNVPFVK